MLGLMRQIGGVVGYVLLFAVLLLIPAGQPFWPRAWVLLAALLAVRLAGTLTLWRVSRSLLIERSRLLPLHPQQPLADKILLPLVMASFAGLVAFVAYERFHLHWLPRPPAPVSLLGLVMFVAGWSLIYDVFKTNAFAATVVRHQQDRAHHLVDSGLYRYVRHPMYASLLLVMAGLGLWLESSAGALMSLVPMLILALRIHFEEKLLREALPDYAAYARRVRWRLLPGIW